MEEQQLIELLEKVIDSKMRGGSLNEHAEHHEFIASWIKKEQIRAERWEEIHRQLLGWGFIAVIGAIGAYIARKVGVQL